jgi:hypothetical protein
MVMNRRPHEDGTSTATTILVLNHADLFHLFRNDLNN